MEERRRRRSGRRGQGYAGICDAAAALLLQRGEGGGEVVTFLGHILFSKERAT